MFSWSRSGQMTNGPSGKKLFGTIGIVCGGLRHRRVSGTTRLRESRARTAFALGTMPSSEDLEFWASYLIYLPSSLIRRRDRRHDTDIIMGWTIVLSRLPAPRPLGQSRSLSLGAFGAGFGQSIHSSVSRSRPSLLVQLVDTSYRAPIDEAGQRLRSAHPPTQPTHRPHPPAVVSGWVSPTAGVEAHPRRPSRKRTRCRRNNI